MPPVLTALAALLLAAATAWGGQQSETAQITAAITAALDRDADEAVALAESAVSRFPDDPSMLVLLGHAYRHAARYTASVGVYERVLKLSPGHPEALVGLGTLRERVNDLAGALAYYERALATSPEFAGALRNAGLMQMQRGNHAAAAEHFARYLEQLPDAPDVRYLHGVTLFFAGRHDEAIESLETGIARHLDLVSLQYALGVVLADRPQEHERALVLLENAADEGFEEVEARYLIGRVHADRGELDAAIESFEATIALDPHHRDAHYRLASALARSGRRDEAEPLMQRFNELQQEFNATEARDKQLQTVRNELTAALAARDGGAAQVAVDRLLEVAPEDPDSLVAAAKVWISAGRTQAGFDAAQAAVQLDPTHWEANYLYGLLLAEADRPADALAPLRRSLEANPLFAATHVVTGNVLMQVNAPAAAVRAYLAAIDLEADNPGYWLNLAVAYGELGQESLQRRAQAEYQRLLEDSSRSRQQ